MSILSETEIFSCIRENLKRAADDCDIIARQPMSGIYFDSMRKALKLVEGACRQAGYWRQDARWFSVGMKMEEAHQRARFWLHHPSVQSKKLFTGLAAALRKMLADIVTLQTKATGKVGMILPTPMAAPHRDTRPVAVSGMNLSPGGIILPA